MKEHRSLCGTMSATFNGDGGGPDGLGSHRILLERHISSYAGAAGARRLLTIGVNPSKASHLKNDNTITKESKFARAWQMDVLIKANLFGLCSTDPEGLLSVADPTGDPENLDAIVREAKRATIVVACWGGPYGPVALHRLVTRRALQVVCALTEASVQLHVLALTKDGIPRHPLYLKDSSTPVLWSAP